MTASEVYIPIITTLLTMVAVAFCKRVFGPHIYPRLSHDNYGKTPIIETRKHTVLAQGFRDAEKTSYEVNVSNRAIFIRLSVSKSGIGTLKGCQGHLVDVTFTPQGGDSSSRVFWDSIPLCWSFTESEKLDIASSVRMMLAICSAREDSDQLRLCTRITPNHYRFTEPGDYRFKVSISAENAAVKVICIDVVWNGKWDEIDAREVLC